MDGHDVMIDMCRDKWSFKKEIWHSREIQYQTKGQCKASATWGT